jgi:hypothetical protein
LRQVIYTDEGGYNHSSLVRDGDTDPSIGLLQSPPDLRQLDWEEIARTIHNALLERGLITLKDVQIRSTEFNQIIMAKVGKKIFALYQQEN